MKYLSIPILVKRRETCVDTYKVLCMKEKSKAFSAVAYHWKEKVTYDMFNMKNGFDS